MKNKINIGLIGAGTVGGGTYKILKENFSEIFRKTGKEIIVFALAEKDTKKAKAIVDENTIIYEDAFDLVKDENIHIVIELIGGIGVSKDLVKEAIKHKKHVVTANKALIAMHGEELVSLAHKHNVNLAYEAAVAGGIPIIKAVREGLAGNKIEWIVGILNGTTNYILTEMKENNLAFDVALKQAQELGFAEADPTFDIEGVDAAHKITILASIAFGIPINFEAAHIEGISNLDQKDIIYAEELGYKIKLLGVAEIINNKAYQRVHPTMIKKTSYIASIDGVLNAVIVDGQPVGQSVIQGEGAGPEATTSALISDISSIMRGNIKFPFSISNKERKKIIFGNISDRSFSAYLRFDVLDKPGVLSNITNIFSKNKVSIKRLIQTPNKSKKFSSIIIITHNSKDKDLNKVVKQTARKTYIKKRPKLIRIGNN